jgi:hypothetical protein
MAWLVVAILAVGTCAACGSGDRETSSERLAERQKEKGTYHPSSEVIATHYDNDGHRTGESRRDTGH